MFTSRESTIKVRSRTFCRTDLRVALCCEVKDWEVRSRSESEIHGQVEVDVKVHGGPNQTSVEKGGDELWIAEKFQSNPEIAGSPRNSFRASLIVRPV